MNQQQHTLEARDIAKSYQGKEVVHSVSLSLKNHEIVGLLGSNGAGKTTIFSIIVGMAQADRGSVSLDGQDISSLLPHKRAHEGIGYLPQARSIFRKLSVEDNLRVSFEARQDLNKKQIDEEIDRLIEQFHLQEVRRKPGRYISGGEQRRVEIARTLARRPHFVLLDEPFANIDPISIQEIQQFMVYLRRQNIGLLITDHNVHAALNICDRSYVLDHGKVIASGDSAAVVANPTVQSVYLGKDFTI